jgi:predicted nucleotidyltransferase component of viral defense system
MTPRFEAQVRLLLRVLPEFSTISELALKGGTAINLFVQDLPRLSVDIDFSYTGLEPRHEALIKIDTALKDVATRLERHNLRVQGTALVGTSSWVKFVVSEGTAQVKVEVNPVLRGLVFPPEHRRVTPVTEAQYGFAETLVVSLADLYAGKMVAALDRQHPRDLFDIKLMLEQDLLTADVMKAFLVYLISHDRRMSELLAPKFKSLEPEYTASFQGMTRQVVSLAELENARETLVAYLHRHLTETDKRFLLSFKERQPEWELLGLPHVKELPAVRWKLANLEKMPTQSWREAVEKLKGVLEL